MEHWETALTLNPIDPIAHNNLGMAWSRKSEPEKARAHFEKALEADRIFTPAMKNLAVLVLKAGKKDEAIQWLDRVQEITPDDAWVKNSLEALRR